MAGGRDIDVHRLGGLGQDAHHHEFGRAEDERAGSQGKQAFLHGSLFITSRGRARAWVSFVVIVADGCGGPAV